GPFVPITGPGNACGTDPTPAPPARVIGFRLTTGTLSGSDFFPFFDATTVQGTPFNPAFQARTFAQGMFFTRMGDDSVTPVGQLRNLTLIGGGIAYDPKSGNSFFRVTDLRLKILVPEPAAGAGLAIGAMLLAAYAGRRERSTIRMGRGDPT
ncbi:PEP-CTERM sorting domain-containing protein, partial [Myxococcota bacterium]|nr:PEP-CTERM sorting domain-containing protein [Myxococcota bacterium]